MSWLALLFLALKTFGPLIVELLLSLIKKSHNLSPSEQVQAKASVYEALKAGDEERAKQTIEHWHRKCEPGSIACPSDVVGG